MKQKGFLKTIILSLAMLGSVTVIASADLKDKINEKTKEIEKIVKAKDANGAITKDIESKTKEISEKVKDKSKKVIDKVTEKLKKSSDKKKETEVVEETTEKTENNNVDINKFYSVPLNIEAKSNIEKAIFLDALWEKIFYSKEKEKNKDEVRLNKKKFDSSLSYTPDLNYNLFSVLLNDKFEEQLNFSSYNNVNNKDTFNYLSKKINNEKFKNHVKSIRLTKEDFDAAKKRIIDYINKTIRNNEENLNSLKDTKNEIFSLPGVDKNEKNVDFFEANKKLYENFVKKFLEKYDEKLSEKVKARLINSACDPYFFKNSLENTKKFITKTYKDFKEKYKPKLENIVKEMEKLKYDEEKTQIKVTKINDAKKDTLRDNNKSIINIIDTGIVGFYEYNIPDLVIGYIETLGIPKNEEIEFKKYYKEKFEKLSKENKKPTKEEKDEVYSLIFEKGKTMLEKQIGKDEFEKEKKKFKEDEKFASDFVEQRKLDLKNYYYSIFKYFEEKIK